MGCCLADVAVTLKGGSMASGLLPGWCSGHTERWLHGVWDVAWLVIIVEVTLKGGSCNVFEGSNPAAPCRCSNPP